MNNALYASVGIRVPYIGSDIYSAMDAYPPEGDDQITYLDWVTILDRAVGLDTNNYIRYHTTNGLLTVSTNWSPAARSRPRNGTRRADKEFIKRKSPRMGLAAAGPHWGQHRHERDPGHEVFHSSVRQRRFGL